MYDVQMDLDKTIEFYCRPFVFERKGPSSTPRFAGRGVRKKRQTLTRSFLPTVEGPIQIIKGRGVHHDVSGIPVDRCAFWKTGCTESSATIIACCFRSVGFCALYCVLCICYVCTEIHGDYVTNNGENAENPTKRYDFFPPVEAFVDWNVIDCSIFRVPNVCVRVAGTAMLHDTRVYHRKRTCNVCCRCKSRDELITVHGAYRPVARIHSYEFGAFECCDERCMCAQQ